MMRKIIDIFTMSFIDLKKIYSGTLLGWFWLIAKPATTILVYWFAFSVGLRISSTVNGHMYFFWLISGMIPWLYVSEIMSSSPTIFKKYSYLVTKMKFPIITIPLFTVLSRLIVHMVLLVIVLTLFQIAGNGLDFGIIQLIPLLLTTYWFLSVIAIIFSFLGSISKDIGEFIKTIITPILFLTPIIWDINTIDNPIIVAVQELNPIHFIIRGYRNILIYDKPFYDNGYSLMTFLLLMLLFTTSAVILYKKLKKEIPDYL